MTDPRPAPAWWRNEPCTAELPLGIKVIDCQQRQIFKGRTPLQHRHRWTGEVNGYRVVVTWQRPEGTQP